MIAHPRRLQLLKDNLEDSDGPEGEEDANLIIEEESDAEGDWGDRHLLSGTGHNFVVVRVGIRQRQRRNAVPSDCQQDSEGEDSSLLLLGKFRVRARSSCASLSSGRGRGRGKPSSLALAPGGGGRVAEPGEVEADEEEAVSEGVTGPRLKVGEGERECLRLA